MSIKLADVAQQLPDLAVRIKEQQRERSDQLRSLKAGIREGDPAGRRYDPPACPPEYTVIATDGSQIDVDRHASVECYLINVGWAIIHYGAQPGAELDNKAEVNLEDQVPQGEEENQEATDRLNLGLRRALGEFQRLAELVERRDPSRFCLAMVDGPLVLVGAAGASAQDKKGKYYYDGIIAALDRLRASARSGSLALIGYTSYPGYRDVVRDLGASSLLLDRHFFLERLVPDQRSHAFRLAHAWGDHRMSFFYIRTEDEIARAEMPSWVADDAGLLAQAHATVLDQCNRGHGYPVALQEAHEQAVVTATDRRNFWQVLEQFLEPGNGPAMASAKSRSKRSRWL